MDRIAQTSLQLYNQLRAQGSGLDELIVVHRAYEFSTTLYSGYYQADGKPFVAHTVRVASVLAHLGCSAELIATGLLHNVYGNGDFGDGRMSAVTEARRRVVREAVGGVVEGLILLTESLAQIGERLIEIATRLDQPKLAAMLSEAIADARSGRLGDPRGPSIV